MRECRKCRKIDSSQNGDVKVDVKASNDIVTALIKLNDRRQVKNGARAQFISRRKRTCSFRLPFGLDISQTNATSFFYFSLLKQIFRLEPRAQRSPRSQKSRKTLDARPVPDTCPPFTNTRFVLLQFFQLVLVTRVSPHFK